ncbi:MAG: hypothetical protein ACOC0M_05855 [Halomonas sp.]
MAKARLTAIDPATGELCTLPQLCARHHLNDSTIRERYHSGARGWDLVAPVHPGRSRAGCAGGRARRRNERGTRHSSNAAMTRDAMIARVLRDPRQRWLAKPLAASA